MARFAYAVRLGGLRERVLDDLRQRHRALRDERGDRSRCGRSRRTFGRSEATSERGDTGAVGPAAIVASRPPGRSTWKLRIVTSPPTVSNTASTLSTTFAKSCER